ncbi:MAG: hypothetical protein LAC69_09605, partial [Chlorobium sp.]|nr:hypothetical protein [Chlorobium sp.]
MISFSLPKGRYRSFGNELLLLTFITIIKEEGFYGRSCTKARYIVTACRQGSACRAESFSSG